MGLWLISVYFFLQKYLVPFIFAIGLIYFIYGFVVYYIIGHKGGDEDRMELGRHNLLKAFSFFFLGLVIYAVVYFIGWLGTSLVTPKEPGVVSPDASVQSSSDILIVPNTPRENQ